MANDKSTTNPYVIGVAAFSTIGGLLFGYDQGVVSGLLEMENFIYHFPRIYFDSNYKGWFVSTFLLCAWLGSLINSPIADKIGRKHSIIVACIIFCIGCVFQTVAINDPMIFAGRGVSGVAVGMLTMVVPMYISETAPPQIRGALVVMQQLSITFGILISYWIDYGCNYIGGTRCAPDIPYSGGAADKPEFDPYNDVGPDGCTGQSTASWRIPTALQMAFALVLLVGMFFLPYSPRWLLSKDRDADALNTLAKLRRLPIDDPVLQDELAMIKAEVLFERSNVPEHLKGCSAVELFFRHYWYILTTWPHFKRVFIGSAVMFFQQFLGCNAIIYYAPTIFGQLGMDGNTTSLLATGIYGVVNFVSTFIPIFLIDRVGRRILLMAGSVGVVCSLVVMAAVVGRYGDELGQHKSAGYAGMVFVYIYCVNFAYSYAPIGWVLPSEIFSLSIRSKAISVTTSATWMCNFIIGLVSPMMLEKITWGTYVFFAAFGVIAFFFTYFFIPETKGRSLEEMDKVFGDTAASEDKDKLATVAHEVGQDIAKSQNVHVENA
ncbi:hypothetical protein TRICI_004171 [Trichomonascus ciferrii]|uniref:Major facilitator superfamily (MFS) profile domain-containing protein n=1 Tax=Trichomonascus ciferrii TaxID=44093 RepID=A0A642V808_9ASCO|nr:hypothetical protein TRICI_004171 [Trichomonascus ciferrii]